MSSSFLSQEEIDALLKQHSNPAAPENPVDEEEPASLTDVEIDTLGEIGNICMGSAATTLYQLLRQRVVITTPHITISSQKELFASFAVPFIVVEVTFTSGLEGDNLLIIKVSDACIIADLMMGGDGQNPPQELSELQLSAVGEAMNQMIGSASTSMSSIFKKPVNISPPSVRPVSLDGAPAEAIMINTDAVAIVSFRMEIGKLIDSEIMQVMSVKVAKREVEMLMSSSFTGPVAAAPVQSPVPVPAVAAQKPAGPPPPASELDYAPEQWAAGELAPALAPTGMRRAKEPGIKNIDLILDVPLQVSVILGRTKKPIKEVMGLTPGTIIELEKLAEEPVDILVNGTLIAHGEVVVINENFGIRITSIASPEERIINLRG